MRALSKGTGHRGDQANPTEKSWPYACVVSAVVSAQTGQCLAQVGGDALGDTLCEGLRVVRQIRFLGSIARSGDRFEQGPGDLPSERLRRDIELGAVLEERAVRARLG